MLAVLLVILAIVGGYWLWSNNSERRLTALLEQLRREGEPVAPADLYGPPVPAGQDAVPELRAAALALNHISGDWKKVNDDVSFEEPMSPEHRRLIGAIVATEEDALALLRSARDKPDADWQLQFNSPLIALLLPDLNQMRNVGQLGRLAAQHRFHEGDHAESVEHVRDTLGVGRAVDRQPILVGHLVAMGINALATHQVERLGPQLEVARPGTVGKVLKPASAEEVQALIRDLLDETGHREGLRDALRGERVVEVDTAIAVAERRLSLAALMGAAGGRGAALDPLGLFPRGLIYEDARIMAEFTTKMQRAAERSPDWPTFKQNKPPIPPEATGSSPFHVMIRTLLPAFDRAVQRDYQARLDRRMSATILAIRLYQADHDGELPPTLEDLVPECLPAVPLDPLAAGGRRIRYVPAGDRPMLYSVGDNGTDEAGSEKPTTQRKVLTRWDREDAIYDLKPKPLLTEEVTPEKVPPTQPAAEPAGEAVTSEG